MNGNNSWSGHAGPTNLPPAAAGAPKSQDVSACERTLTDIFVELGNLESMIDSHRLRIATATRADTGAGGYASPAEAAESELHGKLIAIRERIQSARTLIQYTTDQVTL